MVDLPSNPVARLNEYELRHLVVHLGEYGLVEELHRLLALETSFQSNAWFEARQAYDDLQRYLEDVNCAWRLAEESYLPTGESQEAKSLGLQIRYALITSSVNTLVTNIPPILLAALVEKGIWTPLRGFAYAQRTLYEHSRKEALQRLAPYLNTQQVIEAITIVWDLSEDQRRWLQQLFDLAPEITTKLGRAILVPVENQSQRESGSSKLEQRLGEALTKIAEQFPYEQITDAFKVAQALSSSAFAVLPIFLSRLTTQGAKNEAIKIANDIEDSLWRARIFNAILPYLSEQDRVSIACSEVYHVMQIVYSPEEVEALALLIPYLPSEEPHEFRELRSTYARHFDSTHFTRSAITAKALEIAYKINDMLSRAKALAHLVLILPEGEGVTVLREALSLIRTVEPESYRYQAMEVLAGRLREPLWPEALDVINSVQDDFWRCMTLKPLIPYLPDSLLPETLALLRTLQGCYARYEILESLAPRLTKSMLCEVLQTVEDQDKSRTLKLLAPQLDETTLREFLQLTYPISDTNEGDDKQDDDWNKKEPILEALAPHLSETLVREALAIATPKPHFFQWEPERFRKMRGVLIPQLARLGFHEETMSAIRAHKVDLDSKVVMRIAPHLPETLLGELLAMVKNLSHEYERMQALESLVPYLPPALLPEALKIVSVVGDANRRDQAIGKVADLLGRLGYTQEAVEIASKVGGATTRASILREMTETSAETGRPLIIAEALKATRQIEEIVERAKAVAVLMPYHSEVERLSLVGELLNEMDNQKQAELHQADTHLSARSWMNRQIEILTTLAEKLPEDKRQHLLTRALSLARGTEPIVSPPASEDLAEKFTKLAPEQQAQILLFLRLSQFPIVGRLIRTIVIAWATEDTTNGINGLFGLLSWLTDFERFSMLLDAYQAAWEIQNKEQRAEMFAKLLPLYPSVFIPIVLDQVLAAIRLVGEEIKQGVLLDRVMAYVSGDEKRKVYRELSRFHSPKSGSSEDYEDPFIVMLIEMDKDRKWTDSFPSIVRHLARIFVKKIELRFPSFEPAFRPAKVSETFLDQILLGGGKSAELRDRVQALTRIAALLPQTECKSVLNETLEVIQSMEEKEYDDKATALLRIFPLYPESERLHVFQEALAEVWKCDSKSMLLNPLVELIPHLTEVEKPLIIPDMLKVVLKSGENDRFFSGDRLLQLLPLLSETHTRDALTILRSCSVEEWRLKGTVIIATQLAKLGHEQEALGIISEIGNQGFHQAWWTGWGLARIAGTLPEPLIRQAIEIAQSLPVREAGDGRTRAIAMLSFRLAKFGYAKEALAISRESISGSLWYAITLSAIADLVSEQERTELITESFSVARLLSDSEERTETLEAIRSQWFNLPMDTHYSLWKDWLRSSTTRTRADLLADISSLMPVVAVYGLENALYEVGVAIHDVTRWWS